MVFKERAYKSFLRAEAYLPVKLGLFYINCNDGLHKNFIYSARALLV